MDAAILVVAADDGCMPQTTEHLQVCRQVCAVVFFLLLDDLNRFRCRSSTRYGN